LQPTNVDTENFMVFWRRG